MTRPCASLAIIVGSTVLAAAAPVAAQEEAENAPAPASGGVTIDWRVLGGASYQADTDMDDGGEFNLMRAGIGLNAAFDVNSELRLDATVAYQFDSYDFSGRTGFGGLDPWEDINSLRMRIGARYIIDDQWAVFGGPILSFSAEDDASFSNSFTAGGVAGASYRMSDTFTLGFGYGVFGQIDDDTKIFPFFTFNWKASDQLTIRSAELPVGMNARGGGGIEAAWALSDTWELALGAQYQTSRFRLDDEGVAPDGVGESRSVPIYVSSKWSITPNCMVGAFVGVVVGGELRLENDGGNRISEEDFDPAPLLGGRVSFRF